ncbi:hypothetical protein [Tautonia rosea]|uniref:hypothetical protein n=1 Tax=Tautonia rosea TaxID=2728037 RepID=UPI001473F166|nr:hypothetical protein [Tautonia rosea]
MSPSYDILPAHPPRPVLPKNPSYPQRVHLKERPELEAILQHWDQRIAEARRKLDVLGNAPERASYDRMYAQMLGSRDQIAHCVSRMPMETGDLYAEDEHRLHEAVAALERIFQRWK